MKIALTIYLIFNVAVPFDKQRAVIERNVAFIERSANLEIKTRYINVKSDPCAYIQAENPWQTIADKHTCYEEKITRRKGLKFISTPPYQVGFSAYYGGFSGGICKKDALALGAMDAIEFWGNRRFWMTSTIVKHELGHLLGATHTQGFDVMNFYSNSFPHVEPLKFSKKSIREIKGCIRRMFK